MTEKTWTSPRGTVYDLTQAWRDSEGTAWRLTGWETYLSGKPSIPLMACPEEPGLSPYSLVLLEEWYGPLKKVTHVHACPETCDPMCTEECHVNCKAV